MKNSLSTIALLSLLFQFSAGCNSGSTKTVDAKGNIQSEKKQIIQRRAIDTADFNMKMLAAPPAA